MSLLNKGTNIYTIAKLMGHKSVSSTQVYAKLSVLYHWLAVVHARQSPSKLVSLLSSLRPFVTNLCRLSQIFGDARNYTYLYGRKPRERAAPRQFERVRMHSAYTVLAASKCKKEKMNWTIVITETIVMTIAFTAMILIPLVKNPVWWIHDYPQDIQEGLFITFLCRISQKFGTVCNYVYFCSVKQ